jgi:hypothetical protein
MAKFSDLENIGQNLDEAVYESKMNSEARDEFEDNVNPDQENPF